MRHVVAETATVYRPVNGDRRALTKATAYRRAAMALIKRKHWCDDMPPYGDGTWGNAGIDLDEDYLARLLPRLIRFLKWRDGLESYLCL